MTYIQNSAFAACWDLKEINLPDRLAEIGPNAFEECHSIETIRIPGSVKEISESAFKGCENLKTVIIENGVTTIGDNAFKECRSLQEIYIPDSVTEIGDNAFQECKALHTVRLPNNIELGTAVFKWCYTLANIQTQDKQHLLLKADMFDDGFDIDWDDDDVWEFLNGNGIPHCRLYDEGSRRIGCIGCPMNGGKRMNQAMEKYPKYRNLYLKAFRRMIKINDEMGIEQTWKTPEQVMSWWMQEEETK